MAVSARSKLGRSISPRHRGARAISPRRGRNRIARGKTTRALRALSPPRVVESTDSPRGCKGRNTDNPDPYDIDVQLFFDHRIRLFYRTNASHDLDSEGIQTHALPNGTEYNQRPDWAGKRGTVVLIGNPNVGHPETQGGGKARGARLPCPGLSCGCPFGAKNRDPQLRKRAAVFTTSASDAIL